MNEVEVRRIPSVVIVDDPDMSEGHSGSAVSAGISPGHSGVLRSPPSVPSSSHGRLLPYVPKRYVVPRMGSTLSPSGGSSSSAAVGGGGGISSGGLSSGGTSKRIGRGVSFEDEVIQETTAAEEEEEEEEELAVVAAATAAAAVTDIEDSEGLDLMTSNGGSGNETSAPLAPPPAILRDYIGPAPASILDLKARRGAADVLSPVDAKIDQMLEMELGPGLHGGSYSAGTVM